MKKLLQNTKKKAIGVIEYVIIAIVVVVLVVGASNFITNQSGKRIVKENLQKPLNLMGDWDYVWRVVNRSVADWIQQIWVDSNENALQNFRNGDVTLTVDTLNDGTSLLYFKSNDWSDRQVALSYKEALLEVGGFKIKSDYKKDDWYVLEIWQFWDIDNSFVFDRWVDWFVFSGWNQSNLTALHQIVSDSSLTYDWALVNDESWLAVVNSNWDAYYVEDDTWSVVASQDSEVADMEVDTSELYITYQGSVKLTIFDTKNNNPSNKKELNSNENIKEIKIGKVNWKIRVTYKDSDWNWGYYDLDSDWNSTSQEENVASNDVDDFFIDNQVEESNDSWTEGWSISQSTLTNVPISDSNFKSCLEKWWGLISDWEENAITWYVTFDTNNYITSIEGENNINYWINDIKGIVCENKGISDLSGISEFNLGYVNFTDNNINSIPSSLSLFSDWAEIFLNNNNIDTITQDNVNSFHDQAHKIHLANNNLSSLPDNFSNLNWQLKELYLSWNSLGDIARNYDDSNASSETSRQDTYNNITLWWIESSTSDFFLEITENTTSSTSDIKSVTTRSTAENISVAINWDSNSFVSLIAFLDENDEPLESEFTSSQEINITRDDSCDLIDWDNSNLTQSSNFGIYFVDFTVNPSYTFNSSDECIIEFKTDIDWIEHTATGSLVAETINYDNSSYFFSTDDPDGKIRLMADIKSSNWNQIHGLPEEKFNILSGGIDFSYESFQYNNRDDRYEFVLWSNSNDYSNLILEYNWNTIFWPSNGITIDSQSYDSSSNTWTVTITAKNANWDLMTNLETNKFMLYESENNGAALDDSFDSWSMNDINYLWNGQYKINYEYWWSATALDLKYDWVRIEDSSIDVSTQETTVDANNSWINDTYLCSNNWTNTYTVYLNVRDSNNNHISDLDQGFFNLYWNDSETEWDPKGTSLKETINVNEKTDHYTVTFDSNYQYLNVIIGWWEMTETLILTDYDIVSSCDGGW